VRKAQARRPETALQAKRLALILCCPPRVDLRPRADLACGSGNSRAQAQNPHSRVLIVESIPCRCLTWARIKKIFGCIPFRLRPVERRRELQHVDPICHEADTRVRIPDEANGQIIEQISSGSPSTVREDGRRPPPSVLSSLSIVVPQQLPALTSGASSRAGTKVSKCKLTKVCQPRQPLSLKRLYRRRCLTATMAVCVRR
jgi:hypothetical protein